MFHLVILSTDLPLHSKVFKQLLWLFNLKISTECEGFILKVPMDKYFTVYILLSNGNF